MQRSWVVVANKSNARVFERGKKNHLKLIQCLINPSAKVSEGDQVSDRRGSVAQSNGYGHQSYTAKTSAKAHSVETFAKEINQFLEKNRNKNQFDGLEIVASPSFLGVLKKNLDKELSKQVVSFLNKDFGQKSDDEIEKLIAS